MCYFAENVFSCGYDCLFIVCIGSACRAQSQRLSQLYKTPIEAERCLETAENKCEMGTESPAKEESLVHQVLMPQLASAKDIVELCS